MNCPQPVLATKDLIEEFPKEIVEIWVDNKASKENVARFLKSQGWSVTIKENTDGTFQITGAPPTCEINHDEIDIQTASKNKEQILVFIPTDTFGSGNRELGHALMKNFLSTLKELGDDLWRIILVNGGVKLSIEGSPVINDLIELEQKGVSILVCGTCLNFFNILDKKKVGETTNMLDIITSMHIASKIIRI